MEFLIGIYAGVALLLLIGNIVQVLTKDDARIVDSSWGHAFIVVTFVALWPIFLPILLTVVVLAKAVGA